MHLSGNPPPFNGLPDHPALVELKSRRQWVAWRYLERDGNITKPPVNVHNGYGASHSDPATWASYEEAAAYAIKHGLPGVGYVLTEDDDITGADLDKCRDKDFGTLDAWAALIASLAETYTEISPSGRGLRMLWRGKIDTTIKCDPAHVEVYRKQRYLTLTGNHLEGTPTEIRPAPHTEAALRARVEEYKPKPEPAPEAPPPRPGGVISLLPRAPRPSNPRSEFYRAVNDNALRNLDRWVTLLLPMAEYQPGTKGYRVPPEALGRSLQEDLSIHPNGIVDWGVHDMGDPRMGNRTAIDLVLEYGRSSTAESAALWLCDAMGIPPVALGWPEPKKESLLPQPAPDKDLLLSSAQFVAGFQPPEYLIDGILQRGYLYTLCARTGHGKTAVAMLLLASVARGALFHGREVAQGNVLFLAGENSMDVRARYLVLADHLGFKAAELPAHFLDGVIDLKAAMPRIFAEAQLIGNLALVVVDTAAAYFLGDEHNSNAQQVAYARVLRELTLLPGNPCVVVNCHPVKNAAKDNLVPSGGGAFLNEMDGNLTLWSDAEKLASLHWQGKFRGPEFEPIAFKLETKYSDLVKDAKGRRMPSVVADTISDMAIQVAQASETSEENKILRLMAANPGASMGQLADKAGMTKAKVQRIFARLLEYKLISKERNRYVVTEKGAKAIGVKLDTVADDTFG